MDRQQAAQTQEAGAELPDWLAAALDYLPRWLVYRLRADRQPGCGLAVAYRGRLVLERAFGTADAEAGTALTPRHRFRAASHSKSFTAAGILRLREAGRLRLDDPVGRHVAGLHPEVAAATLTHLLSHGAGLVRDGADSGHWQGRRPFPDAGELRAALAEAPVLPVAERAKYSNYGFALLGQVIEAVTGEPYTDWIAREVVARAGLTETRPDGPPPDEVPFARGHSLELPLGRRVGLDGGASTRALAPAGGFVSTPGNLARFFAGLDPAAEQSPLSRASRREMVRAQWRDPHSSLGRSFGLGLLRGQVGGQAGAWEWFGHSGAFPGYISCTLVLPGRDLCLSLLTNACDGAANLWAHGLVQILRVFAAQGAPAPRIADWQGRWWSQWGPVDLVPLGDHVRLALPGQIDPFLDASEIAVEEPDRGRIRLAGALGSHGEPARLVRDAAGAVTEVWLGGQQLRDEAALAAELQRRGQR